MHYVSTYVDILYYAKSHKGYSQILKYLFQISLKIKLDSPSNIIFVLF